MNRILELQIYNRIKETYTLRHVIIKEGMITDPSKYLKENEDLLFSYSFTPKHSFDHIDTIEGKYE